MHAHHPPVARHAFLPAAALAVALAVLAPPAALAQESEDAGDGGPGRVSPPGVVDLRVGTASPRGDLEDLADAGALFGAGVGYRLLSRIELRAEVAWQNLGREEPAGGPGTGAGPRVELVHYTGGLLVELTDPVISRWEIELLGGAGGTWLDVRDGPAAVPDFSGHRLALQAGGQVGYDWTDEVTLYLRGGAYRILGDEDSEPGYLGSETLLTHEVGLRIRF